MLLAALALLCGCSAAGAPASAETAVESGAYYDFTAVTEILPGRPDIYAVLKVMTSDYWGEMMQGIADAAQNLDCNLYLGGSADESGWVAQRELMRRAVDAGAAAILLAPTDSVNLCASVSEIYNAGTPVILLDTILNSSDYTICYMTDNLLAGETAAAEMLRQMRLAGVEETERAEIAIQIGSLTSQTIIDRVAGFSQHWAKNAPENWVILDDVACHYGDTDAATAYAEQFMRDYPALKGLYGCNNGSTAGFARALLQSGRSDLVLVGFDLSDEMREVLADSRWHAATVLQNQYNMGYCGVQSALAAMQGQHCERRFYDTGTLLATRDSLTGDPAVQALLNITPTVKPGGLTQ